jgi:predicted alpha/beta superfamily hydrolase
MFFVTIGSLRGEIMDRRLRRRTFLTTAGLSVALAPAATLGKQPEAEQRGYRIPFTSVIPLTSKVNGIAYELYVRVPAEYATTDKRYPVVWTLDADYQFAVAVNQTEHLADREHIPQQIVVSIAYAGDYPDGRRYQLNRTRDYTPIFAEESSSDADIRKLSGGAPKFLEMIVTEAMPLIERMFRTDPAARTFVGHSYGGLFGAWVLQDRPEVFDRYLLISPSLWYGDEWILKREARKEYRPMPKPTKLWMAIGSWEQQPGHYPMVEQLRRFAAYLSQRRDQKLAFEHKAIADESHASIFPAALSTGLRHLYPTDWLLAAKPSDLGENCVSPPPAT